MKITTVLASIALTIAPLSAQSFNIIYTFPNLSAGDSAVGIPYIDASGVLYGTTDSGGSCTLSAFGCGTVFSLSPPAQPGAMWTENVLYSFQGVLDGSSPQGGVLPGPNGTFVGTTVIGGPPQRVRCNQGCGTLFQLNPPLQPGGSWTQQTLYDYTKSNYNPAVLLPGPNGVYYGATQFGSGQVCVTGCGSIYELLPPAAAGDAWSVSEIHLFDQTGGANPSEYGRLIRGSDGTLYGTASFGGDKTCSSGCGVVYSLAPPVPPATAWIFHDLYKFKNLHDGFAPLGGLAMGPDGTLYGTTNYGGVNGCIVGIGCGTVFSLTPPPTGTGQWTKTILHSFVGGSDGANPLSGVVLGSSGILYGVTQYGGGSSCSSRGCGVLYQLAPPALPGGTWTETILHAFTNGSDGAGPAYSPAIDPSGVLYGFAFGGTGTSCDGAGCGVIYQYIP